jgi:hypothetical protein
MPVGTADNADDPVLGDPSLLRSRQLAASLSRWDVAATLDSDIRHRTYNFGYLLGLFCQPTERNPVKTRITLLAVVFGAALVALVLGMNPPWPGI